MGRAALVVGAALAPDLDLLLRFVDGQNHHQGASHSLGAAIVAGLVVWIVARLAGVAAAARLGLSVVGAWTSHVLLDVLGEDTHPPLGVPALWPASGVRVHSPWPLFLDIGRTLDWSTLRHDAVAGVWEVVTLLPLLVMVWRLRQRSGD